MKNKIKSIALVSTSILVLSSLAPSIVFATDINNTQSSQYKSSNDSSMKEVSGEEEPVDSWMPDKQLQIGVAKTLGIDPSELTKSNVAKLGTESIYEEVDVSGASSLKGLEYATVGHEIVLNALDGTISDLSPLTNVNLVQLNISNNNVSDLTPLSGKILTSFLAKNNNISELSPLNFSNLSQIDVDNNHISDIDIIPQSVLMVLARNQVITNPPIVNTGTVAINSVKHVSNYNFDSSNFTISDGGNYKTINQDFGSIIWENLDSSLTNVRYNFDRQYDWAQDSAKTNTVYFSGTVIQPFSDSIIAAPVTIKYIDTTGTSIAGDIIKTGNVGEKYTSEQKDITGYTFKEIQGQAIGEFTDQPQTVTYVYTKNELSQGKVTAKYVDTTGNSIAKDEVKTGNIGENYTLEQKDITGYTFKEIQGQAIGEFTDQPQTVTYVYTKNELSQGKVTAKYVDTTGNSIAKDEVKTGNIGENYTLEQKDITGYTFKEIQGQAIGEFTDQPQTVTYVYTKNENALVTGIVIINYFDDKGNTISGTIVKTGNIGENYNSEQKNITGYTFKEIQGKGTGVFTEKSQTVTYIYIKTDSTSNSKPDEKPNNKENTLPSSNTNTLPKTGENEKKTILYLALGVIILYMAIGVSCFQIKNSKIK